MNFIEFLTEANSEKIGVVVQHPDEPELTDFWVFAWPNPDNTISDQSRYLDKKLGKSKHLGFYQTLKANGKPRKKDGEVVYGPFNDIKDLI